MLSDELLLKVYRKTYGYADDVRLSVEDIRPIKKYLEEYDILQAMEAIRHTPATFIPGESPLKRAREIALDAAIQLMPRMPTTITFGDEKLPSPTLTLAEEIYQWLISEEKA